MSMRNEVMLEGSRKSISSYMQMISRDWIKMQWFRGCLLTAPALAVVICPLGSPHSQPSRARTHVEVVRVLSGPQVLNLNTKQGVYDPHGEEGLRHEGGQHAPLRHVFILRWRQTKPAAGPQRQATLKSRLQLAHPDVSHVLILHTQHYTLNVSVGLAKGCEFVFEGEGDESPDWEAGNIIICVLDGKKKGD
ncbi:hypothetical protein JB92DRAFT_2839027 [Gautieria morchelliformis]|nr:hypothetical protein JB92DRAFT_2839027 [Gautieria morchelliformis]